MKVNFKPKSNPVSDADRAAKLAEGGFGKYYTDNMIIAEWNEKNGWGDANLIPYGPLSLDPATSVLHYGQEIFEGLKAYSQPDGGVSLFRPDANAERFNRSAERLALPQLPVEDFVKTVTELVKHEAKWVPQQIGESLYIRPFMIATEVGLGVRPSNHATYLVITTPAGAYFNPQKAVTGGIATEDGRAAPGARQPDHDPGCGARPGPGLRPAPADRLSELHRHHPALRVHGGRRRGQPHVPGRGRRHRDLDPSAHRHPGGQPRECVSALVDGLDP